MSSFRTVSQKALQASRIASRHRCLHQSSRRSAVTKFQMPAMSPTMTEGGISSWKKKEGESFAAGDVLLEIETDKATIDVEAQEDGIVGKILLPDGSKGVKVGKLIALLAEEGDDISNLEVPKEEDSASAPSSSEASTSAAKSQSDTQPPQASEPSSSSTSTSAPTHNVHPTHSRPLFPSVQRLLAEHGIADGSKIEGTGIRGMLTKGDVLAFLGKASGPLGTFKFPPSPIQQAAQAGGYGAGKEVKKEQKPLDGPAIRQLIVSTMLNNSVKARSLPPSVESIDFDSIIADYLPRTTPSLAPKEETVQGSSSEQKPSQSKAAGFLDGLI
ncbi:pyridoxine biosynthesis protein [Marasmius crinis-equi]|uniref:Pyridoxine biosynthesis protein n=1 Tax=Marasmius crinis-equi TaxID=585013 RepID=A0ABR3FPS7_9AGAR